MKRTIALSLVLACLAGTAHAQDIGGKLPEYSFKEFSKTDAQSFADFAGRLILIEVFAYW
ncbi:MAG: hypothetical protein ACYTGZ_22395 [Planctomycetota bacterium]